jgi:hypothetical protein
MVVTLFSTFQWRALLPFREELVVSQPRFQSRKKVAQVEMLVVVVEVAVSMAQVDPKVRLGSEMPV